MRWHDLFAVRVSETENAVTLRLRKRRLQVSHGAGGEHVVLFEQDLHPRYLPLNTWLKVSVHRTVTEEATHVEMSISGGGAKFEASEHVEHLGGALPHTFAAAERPEASLISDEEHIGMISGFRFEGFHQHFLAWEQGRIVSDAAAAVPLKHELNRVNRGTENEGVFLHSLRTFGKNQFQVVEKKTRKPLEIELVRFLQDYQPHDAALRQVFPMVHWADEQDGFMTYVMEYVPGSWDRRRSNILEVFDLVLENLLDLEAIGKSYDLSTVLPDTRGDFDRLLAELVEDPDFRPVKRRLRAYRGLCQELAAHRTVLAHNDIWGANIAVPTGSTTSRLIDIGRVAKNYVGADLIHFRRHYGEDKMLWAELVSKYARAFGESPEQVETGAIAYAAQREIESQLRLRDRGIKLKTGRLSSLLSALPLNLSEGSDRSPDSGPCLAV